MQENRAELQEKYLSGDAERYPISAAVRAAVADRRRICVLGFGISNRPLLRVLLALGARVCVYDRKPLSALGEDAARAAAEGVLFVSEDAAWLDEAPSVVFRSPGIRPDTPALRTALARGARIGGEMDWFLERTPATVIAITGSDGKTTTTTLTARMLETAGKRVFLGGNLGVPLLPLLPQMTEADFAVVELSSFQLSTPLRPPTRAAITNVTPNHLNWHTDMAEYVAAKRSIVGAATRLVTNACCDIVSAIGAEHTARGGETVLFAIDGQRLTGATGDTVSCEAGMVCYRSADGRRVPILAADELLLPGRHNLENFMTAAALVMGYAPPAAMAQVGRTFGGVAHRLERVRELDGITYYNSSIDSSPTRTAAALSALPERSAVVICGGYDKHIPFAPLAQALCARAGAVVLTGETRDKIMAALRDCPDFSPATLRVELCPDFFEAVDRAAALARAGCGHNVLLSPACASFDAFENFEARGAAFRARVLAYVGQETEKTTQDNQSTGEYI